LHVAIVIAATIGPPALVFVIPQGHLIFPEMAHRRAAELLVGVTLLPLLPLLIAALSSLVVYRVLRGRPGAAWAMAGWCIAGIWSGTGVAWLGTLIVTLLRLS